MLLLFPRETNPAAAETNREGVNGGGANEDKSDGNKQKGSPTPSCQGKTDERQKIKDRRRKTEDKMAMIFIAIVSCFLVTNFLRIFLNFHEAITINQATECIKISKP